MIARAAGAGAIIAVLVMRILVARTSKDPAWAKRAHHPLIRPA